MKDFRSRFPRGGIAALQRALGRKSYARVHELLAGKVPMTSVPLAKQIEAATGGLIKWIEWFDDAPAGGDLPDRGCLEAERALDERPGAVLAPENEAGTLAVDELSAGSSDLVVQQEEAQEDSHSPSNVGDPTTRVA